MVVQEGKPTIEALAALCAIRFLVRSELPAATQTSSAIDVRFRLVERNKPERTTPSASLRGLPLMTN